jgi:tRNA dimethylallyltransferase
LSRAVYIVGPTASGKTGLAIAAAMSLRLIGIGVEIINADSIQFFEGLDIGSAKPNAEELAQVPHHLVGHLREGAKYTAGEFRRDVEEVVRLRALAGVQNFLIVGGSGFYIKALEKGLFSSPKSDPVVRNRIEAEIISQGLPAAHSKLQTLDSEAAQKISNKDSFRIARALEVLEMDLEKRTLSEIRREFEKAAGEPVFKSSAFVSLEVTRETLRLRARARVEKMLAMGLVREVEGLLARGLKDWSALQSVGYLEVMQFLNGEIAERDLVDRMVIRTMQLAKKQSTWFAGQHTVNRFEDFELAEKYIVDRLSKLDSSQ